MILKRDMFWPIPHIENLSTNKCCNQRLIKRKQEQEQEQEPEQKQQQQQEEDQEAHLGFMKLQQQV